MPPTSEAQKRATSKWRRDHIEEYRASMRAAQKAFYYRNQKAEQERKKRYHTFLRERQRLFAMYEAMQ